MKIAYLIDQFYLHGGIEKMLSLKIKYWIELYGYDILLVTGEQADKPFVYDLPAATKHIDFSEPYIADKSFFHPKNIAIAYKRAKKLKGIFKKEQPDVIVSLSFSPDQYFLPLISKSIPIVKELHSSGFVLTALNSGLRGKLFSLLKKYNVVVVLNEDEANYYPELKTVVIPNFVETTSLKNDKVKENIIIAAGRIAPVKQFDQLLEAWALIANKFPDWQLRIYGGGDENEIQKLRGVIEKRKIEKQAVLAGGTSQINAEMNKAKVYAMTSATECFPMVLLEAMQAGLALISYDCPHGPKYLIKQNENGLLIEPNNVENFAIALSRLLSSPEKLSYFAAQGKARMEMFSPRKIMAQWKTLIEQLANKETNV